MPALTDAHGQVFVFPPDAISLIVAGAAESAVFGVTPQPLTLASDPLALIQQLNEPFAQFNTPAGPVWVNAKKVGFVTAAIMDGGFQTLIGAGSVRQEVLETVDYVVNSLRGSGWAG